MSKTVGIITIFLFLLPQLALAQLAGTNGKYSCGVNDKGKKTVYLHRRTNQFLRNKRRVSKRAALNDMKQIRRSQSRVVRETVMLNRILRSKSEGQSTTLSVSQFFNKKQQKKFQRIMVDAPVTEHLLSSPTTIDSSVEDVLANFVEIVSNQEKVHTDHFASKKILKNCGGCESDDVENSSSRFRARRKRKRKCDCFTKTVPATLEFHTATRPSTQPHCVTYSLAKWSSKETRNAVSARAFYSWCYSQGCDLRSASGTPPYDDALPVYDSIHPAGEGMHQLVIGSGAIDGPPTAEINCPKAIADSQTHLTGPYYVEARICPLGKSPK